MTQIDSRMVAKAAVRMALTASREEERQLKEEYLPAIRCAAVDCGGEFIGFVTRIVERAVEDPLQRRGGAQLLDHAVKLRHGKR